MRKNIISILVFSFLFLTIFSANAFAEENHSIRMVDYVGVLSESEYYSMEEILENYSQSTGIDMAIVVVQDYEEYSVVDAADDYYDYYGYGYGADYSGLLLFISFDDGYGGRDCYISTRGQAIDIFDDSDISNITEDVAAQLKTGSYYNAFKTFSDEAYDEIIYAGQYHGFKYFIISLIIGLAVAGIYMLVLKNQLKSVAPNNVAVDYVKKGSMKVTESREIYLYRNVVAVAKQNDNNGTSTHTSSSGATHGGGGTKW